MRLLIVDDSIVFRSQIRGAVESSMPAQLIGVAQNGRIALQKLENDAYDVMTLDLEMPEMGGLDVLRELKKRNSNVKVIVFSGQTPRSAAAAFDALKLGAVEVVAKPNGETSSLEEALSQVKSQLIPILKQLSSKTIEKSPSLIDAPIIQAPIAFTATPTPASDTSLRKSNIDLVKPKAIVIGSSTGGPSALEVLFASIKGPISIPIFVVQHMPPVFTSILAQRLGVITRIECAEAKHGEHVRPNRIYVAPGDFHMRTLNTPDGVILSLDQGPKHCHVRPAVDILFEEAANIYDKALFGFILTGMGEDGMLGCKSIKNRGGHVMIQDKESSIVWGMPGAVHAVGAYDKMGSIQECSKYLGQMVSPLKVAS